MCIQQNKVHLKSQRHQARMMHYMYRPDIIVDWYKNQAATIQYASDTQIFDLIVFCQSPRKGIFHSYKNVIIAYHGL